MFFLIFRRFSAPVAGRGRSSVARFGPASGPPDFAREPAFHGEIIPAPRPICVAWKREDEMRLQIALPGWNTGAALLRPGLGASGARCQCLGLATRSHRLGGAGARFIFFGFNLFHADVRDIVAVAE